MQTREKPIYKTLLFWELIIVGLVLLGMTVLIVVELGRPLPQVSDSTSHTEDSGSTTENTLPPPAANPIKQGDFTLNGAYLSCLTAPSVLGIDVSEWQGQIDWQQAKAAGVEFVMIRAGWRGSEQGVLAQDTYAQANYAGAKAAGIKVGAYFFSQAISADEAVEEANYLLQIIKDWQVDMPVVYDWEFISPDSRTGDMDADTLTACAQAFCNTVARAGYRPMLYFNTNQSFQLLHLRELTQYDFWLAQYDTVLDYPYKIDMWQYTETGAVPGISGNVDINLYFPWEE